MSLPIEEIISVLKEHLSDSAKLNAIAKDLIKIEKEVKEASASEKTPKAKNRFVILLRTDPSQAAILKPLVEVGGYVLTVPDDTQLVETYSGAGLLQRIYKAARQWNENLKRKKGSRTIKTFVSAMEILKPKAIKESGSEFKIKASYPAEIIVIDKEEIP